jgi:predicted dehydrogenase
VRIAIVGTGGIAQRHLGVLAREPSLDLVAHLSREHGRAEAQAREWGGRAYDEVEAMLERERPEAVWICVTPDRHGAIEEALIARRISFFVEKPLAADLGTAERIAAALAGRPVVAGVGYRWRALDTIPRVRELLAERPARMMLGAWHDRTPPAAWWRDERRSGGQIVEQATHLVDLARFLLGEAEVISAIVRQQPRADYPDSDVAQVSAAVLRFADGVPGILTATCLLEGRQAVHLQLVCEGRVLTVEEDRLRIATGQHAETIPAREDPVLAEDRAFLRAVRDGDPRQLHSSYADALETHRLCCAIRDKARTVHSS